MRVANSKEGIDEDQIVRQTLFLPHYDPVKRPDTKLFFAPTSIYMFLMFFFSIYERVLKARELVREKVKQDIAELNLNEKVELGIIDSGSGKVNQYIFEDVFVKERYECLLKAIYGLTTLQASSNN
jgi:histone deacetylase complex regulatory component SIN3